MTGGDYQGRQAGRERLPIGPGASSQQVRRKRSRTTAGSWQPEQRRRHHRSRLDSPPSAGSAGELDQQMSGASPMGQQSHFASQPIASGRGSGSGAHLDLAAYRQAQPALPNGSSPTSFLVGATSVQRSRPAGMSISTADLRQYQPTGDTNICYHNGHSFSRPLTGHRLSHQHNHNQHHNHNQSQNPNQNQNQNLNQQQMFSSSQAHLQSLIGPIRMDAFDPGELSVAGSTAAAIATLRKTPKCQQRRAEQLQHQYQAQQQYRLTKPMTSVLDEPQVANSANTGRQLRSVSMSIQQQPASGSSALPALPGGQPLPPPYSRSQQQQVHQQNVICQQPAIYSQFPAESSSTGASQTVSICRTTPTTITTAQANSQASSVLPHQQQVNAASQQVINYQQQQQQQLNNNGFSGGANFHPTNGGNEQAGLTCHTIPISLPVGPPPPLAGQLKSKSCLTCADISIKWYIVVIALLGLICALIGTIVGAVHSAGRDYISLALLLIGVGLVLVAISWIALRISIKTYKTNSSPTQQQRQQQRRQQQQPHFRSNHTFGRLLNAAQPQPQSVTGSSSLHRSLINERFYVMAAAAAAAAAISRQQQQQHPSCSNLPSASRGVGLLSSLKQRIPGRLARLIPTFGRSASGGDSNSGARSEQHFDNHLFASSSGRQQMATTTAPSGAGRSGSPTGAEPNPALAAAAAILHQYQSSGGLLPLHHPAAFLFPPGGHLFAGGANPADFSSFRPPPPSYNASMQDHRLRMLLQERAGLQHMGVAMFPSANPPPPPPPPPPSQVTVCPEPGGERLQPADHRRADRMEEPINSAPLEDEPGELQVASHQANSRTIFPGDGEKLHSSAPSRAASDNGGVLVANDIYVPSGDLQNNPQAAQSSPLQRADNNCAPITGTGTGTGARTRTPNTTTTTTTTTTIVKIVNGSSLAPGSAQNSPRLTRAKEEVKILGYL